MKGPDLNQLKVRLTEELGDSVRHYCRAHNITQTALVQAALRQYISGTSHQVAQLKRLDRLSRQLEAQRRMLHLIAEAFGAYVKLWLGHTPEVHQDNVELARRDAHARYRKWADHVAQRLTSGDTFFLQFASQPMVDPDELDAERGADAPSEAS